MGSCNQLVIRCGNAGGATLQFSQIPLNITKEGDVTDYIVTGAWSKKALEEGQKYTKANLAAKVMMSGMFGPVRAARQLVLALGVAASGHL
jgi:phosphoserine aminotransferase